MGVRKRHGDTEPVDVNKIVRAVDRVCEDLADVDLVDVVVACHFHRTSGSIRTAVPSCWRNGTSQDGKTGEDCHPLRDPEPARLR